MLFFERKTRYQREKNISAPFAVLEHDAWDDFGYKSTFRATIQLHGDLEIPLGEVKILRMGQNKGKTKLPPGTFQALSKSYCSLGQDIDYYKKIADLPDHIREDYLRSMRDIAYNDTIRLLFEEQHEGFRVSLTRFGSATTALVNGPSLLQRSEAHLPIPQETGEISRLRFSFQTPLAKAAEPISVTFDFSPRGNLPRRINVVIGYNGTGKTQLLSNLATVVSGYGYHSKEDILDRQAGTYVGAAPPLSKAVVVSYSAFDTFEIPGRNKQEQRLLNEADGAIFDYVYCGLRERASPPAKETYRLKTHGELVAEFRSALERIQKRDRQDAFRKILAPFVRDASFRHIGFDSSVLMGATEPAAEFFGALSTGHKIVLMIVTQLASHIDSDILVIVDEPEAHLHPPLLASLLHSIRVCLDEFRAHAVIATHSPVVLQETPARYVHVVRRDDCLSSVKQPTIETFGENIGSITEEVFNLDDTSTDWHRTLKDLAAKLDIDEIEKLFGKKLSFTARSYVLSVRGDSADEDWG